MTLRTLIVLTAVTVVSVASAEALSPADKCEAGKLKQAGKYGFCRLKAEAKVVKTGGAPDYTKCDAKLGSKWGTLESKAGGMCPTNGDQALLSMFIAEHTDDVATALSGGGLPGRGQRVQTGQTTCYDSAGVVIACSGTGQDGELQRGLSASYTDNGDGTISDNRTGLMWEKLSDDASIHDKDTVYPWDNAFTTKVATLNTAMFAGYNDWRLPNLNELQSLTNYAGVSPAVHAPFDTGCAATCTVSTCSCTKASFYWSSTTYPYGSLTSYAYYLSAQDGRISADPKSSNYFVRAVRGGP